MKKSAADGRKSPRTNVLMKGTIEAAGLIMPVRVANLSIHGALITGVDALINGERVTFRCNGQSIQSVVAWLRPPYAGLRFGERVDLGRLLRAALDPSPVITKDDREFNFRRPGFRGNQLTDEERAVIEEWKRHSKEPAAKPSEH